MFEWLTFLLYYMFILCELNASSIRNIIVYSHFIMGKCFEIRQKWMKQFKKNGVITIIDGYINLYLLSWILFMFLKKIAKYEHLKIKIIDSISIRGRHMCLLFKRSCLYVPKGIIRIRQQKEDKVMTKRKTNNNINIKSKK